MLRSGNSFLAQKDGNPPATLAAGSAPGEPGVSIRKLRFRGGAHFSGAAKHHQIWFASPAQFNCHIGGRSLCHHMPPGSLAIGPAGVDCVADVEGSFDSLLVAIDPAQFALAAAEDEAYNARLVERLLIRDETLVHLAQSLTAESACGYPNGPLFWHETASRFIDGLLLRHTSEPPRPARGRLSKDVLRRLRDYVLTNLDEPIAVATLADMAGRSPFHFTRMFTQSVGVTPHRYVVHL